MTFSECLYIRYVEANRGMPSYPGEVALGVDGSTHYECLMCDSD